MSIKVMTSIWEHSSAKDGALLVMLAIGDFADDSGKAFPSVQTLAKKARLSERQTQYCLKSLVESGELTITPNKGPHGCNIYRVQILRGADIAPVQLPTGGVQLATGGGAMECTRTVSEPSIEPSVGKPPKKAKPIPEATEVLAYLNSSASKHFRPVESNLKPILARLGEGATVEDCKRVVDSKVATWGKDEKMRQYLRPETVFGGKFWQYEGEAQVAKKSREDLV